MVVIKKYSNRRLYDTEASRYVTLDELATRIQQGAEIQVLDVDTGDDLTQTTLAQIILETRGAADLLPVPLLHQLIRLRDDALGEFFSRYVAWALDAYLRARSWNPLVGAAMGQLGRFMPGGWQGGQGGWPGQGANWTPPAHEPPPEPWREASEWQGVPADEPAPTPRAQRAKAKPESGGAAEARMARHDDELAALREELAALRAGMGTGGKPAGKRSTARKKA